jgi:kumamolisin
VPAIRDEACAEVRPNSHEQFRDRKSHWKENSMKKYNVHPYFKMRHSHLVPRTGDQTTWTVPQLCTAYNWPTNLAGGGVIAIVELGGGWVQSDVDAFFQSINQPSPHITDVSADGTTQNNPNQSVGSQNDPDYEVALDIQVAGAAYYCATGQPATIRMYWSQDIPTAVNKAVADGCDVCSISWGADEAEWGQQGCQQMEAAATAATQAGTLVFAASGDNDSSDGGPNATNVDCPASCPHVVGCGGTSKTSTSETVWNNNPGQTDGSGTGGGYSGMFPVQPWQAGVPNGPGRMVPDVAGDADPYTGYIIYVHGQQVNGMGGTSAVAPLYSGLFASFGTKLGFITPELYQNQLCFNNITQGDNGAYRAGPGPNPCTGLGSPIGTKLAALLVNPSAASGAGSGSGSVSSGGAPAQAMQKVVGVKSYLKRRR